MGCICSNGSFGLNPGNPKSGDGGDVHQVISPFLKAKAKGRAGGVDPLLGIDLFPSFLANGNVGVTPRSQVRHAEREREMCVSLLFSLP